MLVKPSEEGREIALSTAQAAGDFSSAGKDTAAPATTPICKKRRRLKKALATSEKTGLALRLLISSLCSCLNSGLRGLLIMASCRYCYQK